tara:strand:- start:54 stop:374 length:321 start_codon:yes stop_codon:yes gene_type:complete
MWLYTDQGHVSVVADRNNDKKVFVRARNRISLLHFWHHKVIEKKNADYKYRVHILKTEFAQYMYDYISKMEYDNFKGHLLHSGMKPSEYKVYTDVYTAGLGFEDVD